MSFLDSKFTKNVLTLVTGTAIAQAIPLGLSPVLTRLYTPDDFGIFALYMSFVAIGTVLASMKYDLAIILPSDEKDAANITILALFIVAGISTILFATVLVFNTSITNFLISESSKRASISKWLYFVPLSVFLMGTFNAISYWFNRNSNYKVMAKSKVANSGSMTIAQVVLGTMKKNSIGLIGGFILGRLLSVIYLFLQLKKEKNNFVRYYDKPKLISMKKRYRRFPMFTLPGEFINVVSNQLPVFLLGKFFSAGILGNYSLMERVLNAPISLLGRSVLDVFKQKASEDFAKMGNCREIFLKTLKTLAALAVVPCLILFLFGPWIFKVVFGESWIVAGEFSQIFAILFFFKFIASPLSYMFNIAEKQHIDLIWQSVLLLVTAASFGIGIHYNDVKLALICFATCYSILYIINLYLSYRFSNGN
nr:oligosaccharide flippase family protein [uncultured Allomuricauda sp.]